ncbi:hypothetical protein L7F22_038014 [Adiantum nelumboides]|nr:hypothetical protein [Adiantum nelumboides]
MASSTRVSSASCCPNRQLMWAVAVAISMLMYAASLLLFSSGCLLPQRGGAVSHALHLLSDSITHDLAEAKASDVATGGFAGDLRDMEGPWNRLCFGQPLHRLQVALFVKKWPVGGVPGGLERHALTLHTALAQRGHTVHVYTVSGDGNTPADIVSGSLRVHFFQATLHGGFDYAKAWESFLAHNATQMFDVVHTESVALPHWKAREIPNHLAASWHGIGYETVHSDIVQDLVRKPGEERSSELERAFHERLARVTEEIRFFPSYRHHVGTSDYVSDVLRTIYELPLERVHTILNGVNEALFYPDEHKGKIFRARHGVPKNATLVLGAAGRLVRDKGHPLLFEAMSRLVAHHKGVFLLVAGQGPWGERYKELAPNVIMVGSLTPLQLAEFYNAIDVFVNPTLRAQGLDLTLLEAMQCGKPLLATHFSSITWSVIVRRELGYTFSPNVDALVRGLQTVLADGRAALRRKGVACHAYASLMFTATQMTSAYERLFLCIHNQSYCHYPLPLDCQPRPNPFFTARLPLY